MYGFLENVLYLSDSRISKAFKHNSLISNGFVKGINKKWQIYTQTEINMVKKIFFNNWFFKFFTTDSAKSINTLRKSISFDKANDIFIIRGITN